MGRRLLPLLCLPLLAAALTGCSSAGDPVADAAARTAEASSARLDVDVSAAVAGRIVRLRGSGVYDGRSRRARLAYTLDAAGEQQSGEAALDAADGFAAYVLLPSLTERLAHGRRWVRFDVARAMRQGGIDPTGLLPAIEAAQRTRRVGRERVRGAGATRYRVELDVRKLAAAVPGRHDTADALVRRLGAERIPADVWVGDGGLLRRLRTQIVLGPVRLALDATLYDFGTGARVALPAADEVEQATALADAERAGKGVRDAVPAVEAHAAESGARGYLGLTPRLLRRYDASTDPALRIVIASEHDYCIELTVGSATAHYAGPRGTAAPGRC